MELQSIYFFVYLKHYAAMNKFINSVVRVLMLELADKNLPDIFRGNLALMLKQCLYLEVSFCYRSIFFK